MYLAKTRFLQASKEGQKGMESETEAHFASGKLRHKDDRWFLITKGQGPISKRPDSVAGSTQRY